MAWVTDHRAARDTLDDPVLGACRFRPVTGRSRQLLFAAKPAFCVARTNAGEGLRDFTWSSHIRASLNGEQFILGYLGLKQALRIRYCVFRWALCKVQRTARRIRAPACHAGQL